MPPAIPRRLPPDIHPPVYAPNTSTFTHYSPHLHSQHDLRHITSPITSESPNPPSSSPPRHIKPTLKRSRTVHAFGNLPRDRDRDHNRERDRDRDRDRHTTHLRRHTTRALSRAAPTFDPFLARSAADPSSPDHGLLVNARWRLERQLGSGAFAKVYEARDVKRGVVVAVKLERVGGKMLLEKESQIYSTIDDHRGADSRIPRMYYFGREGPYNVLVMDCLGASLGQLLRRRGKGFSTKSVLQMAIQGVKCLQELHRAGVVHRDIKPDNMVVGHRNDARLFLVDFGLATWFKDLRTGRHVPYSERQGAVGTVDFASANAMVGRKISRGDDLISLGYSLVYMYQGSLPWSRVKGRTMSELQDRVYDAKRKTKVSRLCRHMPRVYTDYFRIVRGLEYAERPNYKHLVTLFREAMRRKHYDEEDVSEWASMSSGERMR